MPMAAVDLRFLSMLSSEHAEAAAHACIRALDPVVSGEVTGWEVSVQPPLAGWPEAGYAVRVQARLAGGGIVATRAQASGLLESVHHAFGDMGEMLLQELGGLPAAGWMAPAGGGTPA
jgi:hypothetical protein